MTPVVFAQVNKSFDGPLPAWTDGQKLIVCWQLTLRERLKLLVTGRLWTLSAAPPFIGVDVNAPTIAPESRNE